MKQLLIWTGLMTALVAPFTVQAATNWARCDQCTTAENAEVALPVLLSGIDSNSESSRVIVMNYDAGFGQLFVLADAAVSDDFASQVQIAEQTTEEAGQIEAALTLYANHIRPLVIDGASESGTRYFSIGTVLAANDYLQNPGRFEKRFNQDMGASLRALFAGQHDDGIIATLFADGEAIRVSLSDDAIVTVRARKILGGGLRSFVEFEVIRIESVNGVVLFEESTE